MKNCIFELLVNILTYAIKNKNNSFSQKNFKNVVYTQEFNNFEINETIANGFEYLLKRGLLQLENSHVTFYEKYSLSNSIKIETKNSTKELAQKIILMCEGKKIINDKEQMQDNFSSLIEAITLVNAGFLSHKDKEEIKITLSKILLSLNNETDASYCLFTIIKLLELKTAVKVQLQTNSCTFSANNVKFNYLQFNNENILLYFDKCSFELDNIEDIKLLETIDKSSLQECLQKSITLLENYANEDLIPLKEFFKTYTI